MRGCETCEEFGHLGHDARLPEDLMCPQAIALKRERNRRYRTCANGMLAEARHNARRRQG